MACGPRVDQAGPLSGSTGLSVGRGGAVVRHWLMGQGHAPLGPCLASQTARPTASTSESSGYVCFAGTNYRVGNAYHRR
jgi:hypothetical protein